MQLAPSPRSALAFGKNCNEHTDFWGIVVFLICFQSAIALFCFFKGVKLINQLKKLKSLDWKKPSGRVLYTAT